MWHGLCLWQVPICLIILVCILPIWHCERSALCVFLPWCGLMCFSLSLFCLCWHVYLRWLFSQYTLTSGCPLARCYRWKMLFVSPSLSLSPWATSAKLIHHISPEGPIFSMSLFLSLSLSHTHTHTHTHTHARIRSCFMTSLHIFFTIYHSGDFEYHLRVFNGTEEYKCY